MVKVNKIKKLQYSNKKTVRKNDQWAAYRLCYETARQQIWKQTELINDNKEFWEKLNLIEGKFDDLKKENETLQSKVMVAEKTSSALSISHKKLNEGVIEMERNMHRLEQLRCEFIEIAGVPNSITNDLVPNSITNDLL